jgi:hypothetical protein
MGWKRERCKGMKVFDGFNEKEGVVEGKKMKVAKGREGRTGRDEIVPSDPQVAALELRV